MKLLVFGRTGQVASEMARRLPLGVEAVFLDRSVADLGNIPACVDAIRQSDCDAVVNAAGFTNVDLAETAARDAMTVNAICPAAMATECARKAIPFLHVSSDYVFDGRGTSPISPSARTSPINSYGRSKAQGEALIRATCGHNLILRTSWVFSVHKTNFVKKILTLANEQADLVVVSDQVACPTPASAVADVIYTAAQHLVSGRDGGVYNFTGDKPVSRAEFARKIVQAAGRTINIIPVSTASLAGSVDRPLYTVLDCDSFTQDYDVFLPDWQQELKQVVSEVLEAR